MSLKTRFVASFVISKKFCRSMCLKRVYGLMLCSIMPTFQVSLVTDKCTSLTVYDYNALLKENNHYIPMALKKTHLG